MRCIKSNLLIVMLWNESIQRLFDRDWESPMNLEESILYNDKSWFCSVLLLKVDLLIRSSSVSFMSASLKEIVPPEVAVIWVF